jgi:SAM-dependent methyltransferase
MRPVRRLRSSKALEEASSMETREAQLIEERFGPLCCPRCRGDMAFSGETSQFECLACGQRFATTDNIAQLFWPNEWEPDKEDVTARIRAFYEDTPFPNYEELDSAATLLDRARARVFGKLLDEQIPFGTHVLECGCGTGQLTNFLAIAKRYVVGTDLCLNSLKLAQSFKERNQLNRAFFMQMNLFRPCFRAGTFDLVISIGVLHHTSDPFLAFRSISTLVKPGGYVLVGLYHRYGRLLTDLRRLMFGVTGDRMRFVDRSLATKGSESRMRAWFRDQYKNPHESKHTIGEVLGWLKQTGFDFVTSIPKSIPFQSVTPSQQLFTRERPGNAFERMIAEPAMMLTASRDGGLFIVIGRKDRS